MRALALALAMAVAGCALVSPPERQSAVALLSKMPEQLPRRAAGAATVLVLRPEASPVYDTTRMAYSPRAEEVRYFRQHEWGAAPSEMLHTLVVRTLERTGYLRAVLTPPYAGRYRYSLRTEIVELVQDFAEEPPAVRLRLRLRLSNDAAGRVVATREIAQREPMRQKTPEAGIAAANDAVAQALAEVARFVLETAN